MFKKSTFNFRHDNWPNEITIIIIISIYFIYELNKQRIFGQQFSANCNIIAAHPNTHTQTKNKWSRWKTKWINIAHFAYHHIWTACACALERFYMFINFKFREPQKHGTYIERATRETCKSPRVTYCNIALASRFYRARACISICHLL